MVCALPVATQKDFYGACEKEAEKWTEEELEDFEVDGEELEFLWQDRGIETFSADPIGMGSYPKPWTEEHFIAQTYTSALKVATRRDVRNSVDRLLKARTKKKRKAKRG